MATKGYPGLVVVPPSDRWIIRRRVVHWAFFIIAVAWIASASRLWVPSFDNNRDCQPAAGQGTFANFPEECSQSDLSVSETESRLVESTLAKASQGGNLAGSHNPKSTPITGQLVKQQGTAQKSMTKLQDPLLRSSDRAKSPPPRNGSAANVVARKPSSSSIPDTRLAEQGDAFAQYRLGRFYAQLGGPHAPESVSWYVKASDGLRPLAEAGDGKAMYVLGVMYAFGRGVAKDREQARLWLAQAVDQKVPAAHVVLARLDGHRGADSR